MFLLNQVATCAIYMPTNRFQLYMLCYRFMDFRIKCFTSHLDQKCWTVINTWHQGHKWDKNIKADIKEDLRVEWIFLVLDNKQTVNTVISSFQSQKAKETC